MNLKQLHGVQSSETFLSESPFHSCNHYFSFYLFIYCFFFFVCVCGGGGGGGALQAFMDCGVK